MRSEVYIRVTCDCCQVEELEIPVVVTTDGIDKSSIKDELQSEGWQVLNGRDICESCIINLD